MKLALTATCLLQAAFVATLGDTVASAQTQHVRLVPAPVEIRYGSGSIDPTKLCVSQKVADKDEAFALKMLFQGGKADLRSCSRSLIPVKIEQSDNLAPLPMPGDVAGPDSREAYSFTIASDCVTISAKSSAATYHAVQTLLQMIEHSGEEERLPFATVKDWPTLAYRGTLTDAGSEGPMLTLDEVMRQIDQVAKFKGNQYFFFSEANIELRGYPLLNPEARFTQEQIRKIIAYARQRHVDVVPAVEMYAHLHDLFWIEKYSGLADFPHGTQFDPTNSHVKAILEDWTAQISELFPSKFVDVGFDETWSLQKASAKTGIDSTPVQLFTDQLKTVTGLFQAQGKTVMAYADIMVKFPGIISRLPPGLIALPWWYEPIHEAEYDRWLAPLAKAHVPHVVTTGVTSWDQIAPDFNVSFANIDTFLVAGQKSHSMGLLNTLWTDDGQALLQMSWPGIAYGAAAAWQTAPMQAPAFFTDYTKLQFSTSVADGMTTVLTELSSAEDALQKGIGNETMLQVWRDPFRPASLKETEAHAEYLRQARLHAEAALTQLYAIRDKSPETPQLTSYIAGAQMIDLAGLKFLSANEIDAAWKSLPAKPTREHLMDVLSQGISNETHSRCMDMMDDVTETRETYRAAWLQQYTANKLGTALGRWDAEYQFWMRAQTNFELLRTTFKTGDALPSLRRITKQAF